jgi:diadenylate cyclase
MFWVSGSLGDSLRAALEILVLAAGFYYVFVFFRGTRSVQVLAGLILLIVILIGLTRFFHFDALNWLLRQFSLYLSVALLVIFQPEIRRALAELGRQPMFDIVSESRGVADGIVDAVALLAERRIGALIAIERKIGTLGIQETGVKLDCRVNADLLASLFFPHTPLHDGGVIVRGSRIVAAGCLFPLSQREEISRGLGTRHRAAMGLSEETDAIVIVVSEETGTISVSTRGRLSRDFDPERLRRFLTAVMFKAPAAASPWFRARQHLDLSLRGIAKAEDHHQDEEGSRGA